MEPMSILLNRLKVKSDLSESNAENQRRRLNRDTKEMIGRIWLVWILNGFETCGNGFLGYMRAKKFS